MTNEIFNSIINIEVWHPPFTNREDVMSNAVRRQVFASFFSFGAYVPWAIGGLQHPQEINIATFGAWMLLTVVLAYSAKKQGYDVWILALGFFFGNSIIFALGLWSGKSTFNIGVVESVVLYGLIGTVAVATIRWFQGHAEDVPKVLFIGAVCADILSFWPQLKQYLLPHEQPTPWIMLGYCMALCGIFLNLTIVERFFHKFFMNPIEFRKEYKKGKSALEIVVQSLFSIENVIILPVILFTMIR